MRLDGDFTPVVLHASNAAAGGALMGCDLTRFLHDHDVDKRPSVYTRLACTIPPDSLESLVFLLASRLAVNFWVQGRTLTSEDAPRTIWQCSQGFGGGAQFILSTPSRNPEHDEYRACHYFFFRLE
jgi:hypothetical protein